MLELDARCRGIELGPLSLKQGSRKPQGGGGLTEDDLYPWQPHVIDYLGFDSHLTTHLLYLRMFRHSNEVRYRFTARTIKRIEGNGS